MCVLKEKHIRRFRKRFQFPEGTIVCLPRPNEKAYALAHSEMCFCEASFLCGLRFPIHPFIMELLSRLKIAPGQLVLNTWQIIISCMLIWMFVNEGDMIRLNEFLYLNRLKLSTHYGYYELCWVIGNLGLLTISPLIFMTGI